MFREKVRHPEEVAAGSVDDALDPVLDHDLGELAAQPDGAFEIRTRTRQRLVDTVPVLAPQPRVPAEHLDRSHVVAIHHRPRKNDPAGLLLACRGRP